MGLAKEGKYIMEISANTVNILKNFSAINGNIVIKPGNKLMTISEAKNVLAEAQVPEEFNSIVGIYDLTEFLNVLGLVDKPRVRFEENYMNIGGQSGRELVKYYYADTDMLTSPTKPIEMPDPDVWFTLDEQTLMGLKRAASVFGHGQLSIEPDNGSIKLSVVDPENSTANEYSIDVDGGYNNDNFKFILNITNLKMVSDTYQVKISSKLISQFTNEGEDLTYWVALEKSSQYGE
tara:strand:+ start:1986 stop:2690 length:705 start_codon:yes stop_codon:yes gene_type:complete